MPAVAAATPAIPVSGRGRHVLYVDDEDALVFLTSRILERLGYRVSGFSDPVRALQAFRANPYEFDAVVTDLSMPGMNGFDLASGVLATRADIAIIMTSGYVRPQDRQAALSQGIRDLILKPDTVEQLGRALDRALSDGTAAD